jgi:tetratricopeptide (TPR) repeat protein/transglutaminase-like putative cysteine protease
MKNRGFRFTTLLTLFGVLLPYAPRASAQRSVPAGRALPLPGKTSPQAPAASDYSKEDFVVETYDTTARFENDGTGERDLSVRVRIQSDAGAQQFGELVFGYNSANEEIEVRSVRVHKADGAIVTAAADAVKDMTAQVAREAPLYTDYKEKHITVPVLRPGDTLEYEIVSRVETPLAPGQFWFEHNFSDGAIVLDERLELNLPRDREIRIKTQTGAEPEIHAEGDRRIYLWKRSNLAHAPQNEPKKKSVSRETNPPAVELSTFTSWEQVAQWYANLEQGLPALTPELRAKAQDLTAGRMAEEEKIRALYDYVSKNIRYVSLSFGGGRYQPHGAAEILANQYGDCKDKHTLLAALLEAIDVHPDAVLIPFTRKVEADVPSPSQFDHVITAVPRGSELLWMDTTAEVAPFRFLTPNLRGKRALLVSADGSGKLVTTPADPPFPATQRVEIDGRVSELGKFTARLRYTLRGDNEFALRVAFRRTPQSQWKQVGQTVALLDGFRGDISSVKPSEPAATERPFELALEYSQPNFLDWSAKKSKLTLPLPVVGMPETAGNNADTIHLGSPLTVDLRLKLELPANDQTRAPVAVAIARDYAEYRSSYKFEGTELIAERTLRFKMRDLPASRAGDYLAFSRAVEADEAQALVVESAVGGTPTIPASAKPDELAEAGVAALNSGNSKESISLLKRALELNPKYKHAWDNLGLAYLRLGSWNEAIAAFQKQIELDPYDQNANNHLGLAFGQLRKYDDATAAFRKQIELNPLDPIAHASLGQILLEQHKYAEAAPELDKATVLTPDNPMLQLNLGQAYLHTEKKDDAIVAFDKAAQISPTPPVWNNVAYNLAEANLRLDRAQQYAESAVQAIETDLRKVDLEHLSEKDLTEVIGLASYWDTLGWVHFRRSEFDMAEKYIRASWLLDQHAEVGDHLAQIHEKRGEKDLAIKIYGLALAAPHPIPETRARLAALLGSDAGIDALVAKSREELPAARTFSLGKLAVGDAKAELFLLLAPGEKGAILEAIRFRNGSDKSGALGGHLRSLNYGDMFPNSASMKLVRRGTLSCSSTTNDCNLVLTPPEDVRQ